MMSRFPHPAEKTEHGKLSPLFPSVLAALILIATVAPASQATAECQTTDLWDGGSIQGMTAWKDSTLNIPPFTITVPREIYGELLSFPMPEVALHMKNNRFTRGNTQSRGMDSIDTCWNQYNHKSAPVHQAMIKSIGKSPVKAFTQIMRLPASPYKGRKPIIKIGLTSPEVLMSAQDQSADMIGPVLENRPTDRSGNPGLNPANTLSLFEDGPTAAWEPHQHRPRLPLSESLRMNRTTTSVLHGGNCPSSCP